MGLGRVTEICKLLEAHAIKSNESRVQVQPWPCQQKTLGKAAEGARPNGIREAGSRMAPWELLRVTSPVKLNRLGPKRP